ncbi:MAG TPA: hypothetical protein VHF28_01220 [Nitrososphaera sp.]|nr:hypothetical protein [Nitrososphaera sp.]
MKRFNKDYDNKNVDKTTAIEFKMYDRFAATAALPIVLMLLTLIYTGSTVPVQATGGSNETAVTPAPSGAAVGAAGGGTNVTTTSDVQSPCLPQNATTTTGSRTVNGTGANATTTNDTTTTFAPGGASIGANDTSTSNATAGNTTMTTTNNTTTATVAPGGASLC